MAKVNDDIPSEAKVEAAVRRLPLHRVSRHTHLRAEHFKQWQKEAYPGEQSKNPTEETLCMPVRPSTSHVTHMVYPLEVGIDNPGPDYEGDDQHKRHWPSGDTVEGGGGADQHSPLCQPTDVRRPPWVQGRKRDEDEYNGVKSRSGACQYRPVSSIPGISGPLEVLQHRRPGPPANHTGWVWSRDSGAWDIGDFPGLPEGGAEVKQLPQAGLPFHKGYKSGRTHVPEAVQRGGRKRYKNLAGHDIRIPEGGSGRTGRDRWAVCGSLLYIQWHGRLTQLVLAAALHERPGWPV